DTGYRRRGFYPLDELLSFWYYVRQQLKRCSNVLLPSSRKTRKGAIMMDGLQRRIQIARGKMPTDLVLRNTQLVNVCSGECYAADVAIADGRVVGVDAPGGRNGYQGREERDLQGRWLTPGLIDGHMHIESTMMVLAEFARIVTPRGVTAVIL